MTEIAKFSRMLAAYHNEERNAIEQDKAGFSGKIRDLLSSRENLLKDLQETRELVRTGWTKPDSWVEGEFLALWQHPLTRDLRYLGNRVWELHTETIFLPYAGEIFRAGRYIVTYKFPETARSGVSDQRNVSFRIPQDDPDYNRNKTADRKEMHPHMQGEFESTSICWGMMAGNIHTPELVVRLLKQYDLAALIRVTYQYLQCFNPVSCYRDIKTYAPFPTVSIQERNAVLNRALAERGLPGLTEIQQKTLLL